MLRIGKTDLIIEQNGFGALPIQRISHEETTVLLHKAVDMGMNFFDTARGYTDSEEKLGNAFHGRWSSLVVASKTPAQNAKSFWEDLTTSLRNLQTDTIDIFQFHNPSFCPKPDGEDGLYNAMLQAKKEGKIRYIGITNHRLDVAHEAVESGLYDTLQFPFSYISGAEELELYNRCVEKGMGFIAMKALAGGLITNAYVASAWISQYSNAIPIWGIQRMSELEEFGDIIHNPPALDETALSIIATDREQLKGDFCRGCGYCMPCPKGIDIRSCARASLLLRRAPTDIILSEKGREMMEKVLLCVNCGLCKSRCPYSLDIPMLIRRNYADYRTML